MKNKAIFVISLLILWELSYVLVNNDILIPSVLDTMNRMFLQLSSSSFYHMLFTSLLRLGISLFLSLFVSLLTLFLPLKMRKFISELINSLRVVPTAALILLLLVLMSRENTIYFITWIVMTPLMLDFLDHQIQNLQRVYRDPLLLYGDDHWNNLVRVILPLCAVDFINTTMSSLLLGFKVLISSEIIVSIQHGFGRDLQQARYDLDMSRLFADMIWMILIALIIQSFFKWLKKMAIRSLYH